MERIIRIGAVLAVLVVLAGGPQAEATIVELPLDAAGEYERGPEFWSLDFDLGVEFTEISHVYRDWSGEITAGLATDSVPSEAYPIDVGIVASLGSNPYVRVAAVWGGEDLYPSPELYDSLSEFRLTGPSTWSDLLDGTGRILIEYTEPMFTYLWSSPSMVAGGLVVLDSATLVVEGTLVPEPATVVLLGLGGVLLAVRRRRRRI